MQRIRVDEPNHGVRLDVLLSLEPSFGRSRSFAQKIIDAGLVSINGKLAKSSARVRAGDEIAFEVPAPLPSEALPESIPIDVVYEDSQIIVVNKPRGMVVHPAAGNRSGTLVNALLARCPDISAIGDRVRPGIVHRLDKDTTGVLVVAKNERSLKALQTQIKARTAKRRYVALVNGVILKPGMVDAPIGRDPKNRKKMAVVQNGRPAVTKFCVIERFERSCLLRIELETGRTHQIRVHMAHIGHPVANDSVYGRKKTASTLKGQALHAYELGLCHPETGVQMLFRAGLPEDFRDELLRIGMEPAAVDRLVCTEVCEKTS